MTKFNTNSIDLSEEDILNMMNDTGKLAARFNATQLSTSATAAQFTNSLTDNVEFWKWMGRNYSKSGIFNNNQTMQEYIQKGVGNKEWMVKQLQGKGFEWDWMKHQRGNFKNMFKTYDAGDIANRAASDITETHLLSGKTSEYQMKAYTGKSNPSLKNTPKDMTVVTNAEKVDAVKNAGYDNVQSFQDKNIIKKSTNERLEKINNGKAQTSYNFKNVAGTMAKAGITGCIIGIGVETISSYKSWKNGNLTDEEYMKEVLKSGGDAGLTGALTSGVMIPISSAITAAGASTLITLPIAFVVGSAINNIIAPCFARGKYREILSSAKYYQNLDTVYTGVMDSMEFAANQYCEFIMDINRQQAIHQEFKNQSMKLNQNLKDLYDSI